MRAFCTVSAPLEVCAPPSRPLPPGTRFLALKLLGTPQPRTLYFLVEAKSRVREVYAQTCHHFSKQGMLDTELFGLAVLIDGEYLFADPESKLSKYGPKSWRSSHTHGLDANGKPLLELHFRVQFYIESPLMLRDEVSRHNYYLQLKYNAVNRELPKECSEQSLLLLSALSLQADLGDCGTVPLVVESSEPTASQPSTSGGVASSSVQAATPSSSSSAVATASGVSSTATGTVAPSLTGSCSSSTTSNSSSSNISSSSGNNSNSSSNSASTTSSSSASSSVSSSVTATGPDTITSLPPKTTSSSSAGSVAGAATSSTNTTDYFRADEYLNPVLRTAWGMAAVTACHRENRGLSRADAETHYIREACNLNEAINAHIFRMRQSKSETGLGTVALSIYAKGIRITVDGSSTATTFHWPTIGKLSFDRKKFEIRSGDAKITLYSTNDDKNKMILALCRETHQFSMKIAPRLTEAIKREEEESSCIHGYPYLYSRALNLPYKSKSDQRISVISSTSSNTTSGIVSDRVHSEDELEIMINTPPSATLAAPSTESLALAHLLDCPSVSRQTSSVGQVSLKDLEGTLAALSVSHRAPPPSSGTTATATNQNSLLSVAAVRSGAPVTSDSSDLKPSKDCDSVSPSSQHAIGSQCSSTCSTVVVTATGDCLSLPQGSSTTTATTATTGSGGSTATASTISPDRRQTSTCSSLILGFSHTAQNSTLSVATSTCLDHDINEEEEETHSGVYTIAHVPPTETSGVYTMNSSEMTGQSSEIAESESHESSHYGSFQPCRSEMADPLEPVDSVDGDYHRPRLDSGLNSEFRMRSDSNVSAAGSFRGDGSDPTDNKHSLLSAEELTDLIVGRGTYPSRKTVSHTLDSDCDYVTLPLPLEGESYLQGSEDTAPTEDEYDDEVLPPPAPPKRIDSNLSAAQRSIQPALLPQPPLPQPPVPVPMQLLQQQLPQLKTLQSDSPPPPPPPYNAHHETTGLRGPDIRAAPALPDPEAPAIPLRDPPPYPQKPITMRTSPVISVSAPAPPVTEEVPARFITTRPQINILKAHASVVGETPKPSYAAPTVNNICNLAAQSQQAPQVATVIPPAVPPPTGPVTVAVGPPVPGAGYAGMHHKAITSPPPPYPEMPKPPPPQHRTACVLLPVIKPRQYHPPPPPTMPRQPPPPPPSAHPLAATVYTSQLARSQIELYQQQLYSDVDYVIYPIQDPSISQQEYLDAKQGSILAAMAQSPPPPPYLAYHTVRAHNRSWDACKNHAIYRSTPYLSMALSSNSRYASTQNLSDTYVQLPGAYSPLYSPSMASLCSSYEPPPPPPLRPRPKAPQAAPGAAPGSCGSSALFARSRSDDNILNSCESAPKIRRQPPPPPPPPYESKKAIRKPPLPLPPSAVVPQQQQQQQPSALVLGPLKPPQPTPPSSSSASSSSQQSPSVYFNSPAERPPEVPAKPTPPKPCGPSAKLQAQIKKQYPDFDLSTLTSTTGTTTTSGSSTADRTSIDIKTLREKSKHLDLPLISALMHDRSLLKQTRAFVMPKHPSSKHSSPGTGTSNSNVSASNVGGSPPSMNGGAGTPEHGSMSNGGGGTTGGQSSPKSKYPVSGLSTTQLAKPRKTSASHRHPNDKLPPLPGQTAEGNNYVMDPTPTPIKQKSFSQSSQPSA
ncbi:protein expanded [Anopheles aquasalis]|uniref:protein expanded n=1 Tax=Anopheles aquasalis TaxID=42839 RepID=UPI00215A8B12|nr:protein expanded [Anopheles aquasalis]